MLPAGQLAKLALIAVSVAAAFGAIAGGCNPASLTVTAQRLGAPDGVGIRRVAVMPFTAGERVTVARPESAAEPSAETPAQTVAAAVTEAMRRLPEWQVIDSLVTAEACRRRYGRPEAQDSAEAVAVGKLVGADAVLSGQVKEFYERVGAEIAAQRPARVSFDVELTRVPSGEPVWRGAYAETQQALSDNLWNLLGFLRTGGRWVCARELAAIGAERVVVRLHAALYGTAKTATTPADGRFYPEAP